MRISLVTALLSLSLASPRLAAAAEEAGKPNLLMPHGGLMFWTLAIFLVLLFILSKFAFKPLLAAVDARERALQEMVEGAKRDREEAARLLAEHRAQLDGARAEAQKLIAEGRATGEKMKQDMLEETRREQQGMLERARREIGQERDLAIVQLRREAVDLAIAGASKVIERNLDSQSNRKLVDEFLADVARRPAAR